MWKARPWSAQHPYGLARRSSEEELSEASTKEMAEERDQEAVQQAVDKKRPWMDRISEEETIAKLGKRKKRVRFIENLVYNQQEIKVKTKPIEEKVKKVPSYKFVKNKLLLNNFEFASNYEAIDKDQNFGLILTSDVYNFSPIFTAHARRGKDPECVLKLKPGDVIHVVTRKRAQGTLRVEFVSQSRYFSPGQRVRSVTLGVSRRDWEDLKK